MRQYDDLRGEALGIDHFPGHDCFDCGHETPYIKGEDGDYDYLCVNPACSASITYDTGAEEDQWTD